MKQIALIAAFALALGVSSAEVISRVADLRVDQFSPFDRRTYEARYLVNSQLYVPGGPIFIYITGAYEVSDEFLTGGAVFEIAQDVGGLMFALEHRYLGTSTPTEDTSIENLQWLTIHQAAADIAQFVAFVRANYDGAQNSRVILWGRTYGGALAVWARLKYPNAVDGVWASSAPIKADISDTQNMRNAFYTINSIGGSECGNVIRGAFNMIENAIRSRDTSYVSQRLRLCSPIDIDSEEDVTRLFHGIAGGISGFVSRAQYPDINEKCIIMSGNPASSAENNLDAFARWFVDDFNKNIECLNYTNAAVLAEYQDTAWHSPSTITGNRQRLWIQCTQLGQFPIANKGEGHPFGSRFDDAFYRHWCAQTFNTTL